MKPKCRTIVLFRAWAEPKEAQSQKPGIEIA